MRKTFDATVKPVASRNNKKREKKRDDKAKEAAKKPQGPAASVFEKDRETDNRIKKDSELGKRRKEITDMKEIKVEKKQWVHKKKFDAAKRDEVKMGGDVKGKDGRVVDKNRERKEGGSTDKRSGRGGRGGRGGSRGGGSRGGGGDRGRSSSRGSSRGGRGGGREDVNKVCEESIVTVPMKAGDVLLCDNYRVLHGRDIFEGDRLHAVSWFGDEKYDAADTGGAAGD